LDFVACSHRISGRRWYAIIAMAAIGQGMRNALAAVAALVVGISTIQLANGFLGTLVSIRVASDHFESTFAGLILAAYYAGYSLGAMTIGNVIQRIGHIRAFAALAGLVAASVMLQPVVLSAPFWVLARGLTGFGCAGLFIATESWLNAKAPTQLRGAIFATYMGATYATFGSGQFMLNLADPASFELFALAGTLFCLALVPVSITHAAVPTLPPSPRLRLGELRHVAPVAIAGCAASGLVSSMFYALMPVFAHKAGYTVDAIAALVATTIAGGFAFQVPVGWLSDRMDRRILAGVLSVALALMAWLMTLHDPVAGWPAYLNAFLLGGCFSTIYPVCVAHANDRVAPERAVAVSGQLILISGIASCLGPLVGTWLMQAAGIHAVFWCMAAVGLCFAADAVWRTATTGEPKRRPRLFTFLSDHASHQIAHVAGTPNQAEASPAAVRAP
jgi:MFS family permease